METKAAPSCDPRLPNDSIVRATLDQAAEERSEDDGMPEHLRKGADPQGWELGRTERNRCPEASVPVPLPLPRMEMDEGATDLRDEPAVYGSAENTDLERRVLAHERILQALIAHISATDPELVARLHETFLDPMRLARCEHDYTDTDSHAGRFIDEVTRLAKMPLAPAPCRELRNQTPIAATAAGSTVLSDKARPTLFEISYRTGLWAVTKNGRFFRDYSSRASAQHVVQEAVDALASKGGAAVVSYTDPKKSEG